MRDQIIAAAREELRSGLAQVVQAAEHAIAERRATAHLWSAFHRRMAQTLPRWRGLARAWHRSRARRYGAFAWAQDLTGSCSGAGLAQAMGLPR